ncbi:MAG: metal dependent phosphohydrolase [Cenarchaeum symbiont of Oopsacas minuta]|nr:metal dependent phosphohydrolase [Cenarchaeum symbiont of Oopsacas minuta]
MMEEFFSAITSLKKIQRQGWIDKAGIDNPESVADHSYSVAVMAMVFGDDAKMDSCKMIQMALLHDMAESIIGDLTPEMITKVDKTIIESAAIENITKTLPKPLREKYRAIWEEYAAHQSKESKMVHEIDKFDMGLQANIYAKDGASSRKDLQVFIESAEKKITNPKIKSMLELFSK